MNYYIINLLVVGVVIYRILIGAKGGLFNEFINLINVFFSAGMSLILFRPISVYFREFLVPSERIALIITFWGLFFLFYLILWLVKQLSVSKIYTLIKEEGIAFPFFIDKVGGLICGILLSTVLLSSIFISLYIAPATKDIYNLRKQGKIIFNVDEVLPRGYSILTRILPEEERFDWKEFMNSLEEENEEK